MNVEQLLTRFNGMCKPETDLMRDQRRLGLMVVGEAREDVDPVEFLTFCVVLNKCKERVKNGDPIPEDLTDELLEARGKAINALKPENIVTYRADPA